MKDDGRVINTITGEEEVEEVDNHDGGALEEAEVVARQERNTKNERRREKKEKGEKKVTQFSAAERKYQQILDSKKEREREKKKQRNQLMKVNYYFPFSLPPFPFPSLPLLSSFSFLSLLIPSFSSSPPPRVLPTEKRKGI